MVIVCLQPSESVRRPQTAMYFLRLEPLKRELAAGPLPAQRALPYAVAWMGLSTFVGNPQFSEPGSPGWDWFVTLFGVVAALLGTVAAYRANGGAEGSDFVGRLLAVWWVVGWRVLLMLALPIMAVYLMLDPPGDADRAPRIADLITTVLLTVPMYWRAAVHMRDIRRRSQAQPSG